ncbi:MAG: DUF86 domain-containing protein [Cyanobacteria bacterium SBLK]|nr:DUF86 domain-containing protein [Cyanobacteria bacterium SBLK]
MNEERDRVYIQHILECIDRIKDYTRNGKNSFMNESIVQDAVLRRLQTMAESTQRLSEDLKSKVSNVDWRALSGFRNILVHDYLSGIDRDRVWDAIINYLPSLEQAIRQINDELDRD